MIRSALLFAMWLWPACLAAAPVRVELLPQAVVNGATVKLADVARLEGDRATIAAIESLAIARAPRAGGWEVLPLEAVRRGARIALGREIPDTAWVGDKVRVERAAQLIEGGRIERAAVDYLAALLGGRASDVSVVTAVPVRSLQVSKGVMVLKARGGPEEGVGSKRQVVWVDVDVDGEHAGTASVGVEVSATQEVSHLRRAMAAGEVIHSDDVEPRRIDATRLAGVPTRADLEGVRLRRAAMAGHPLLQRDVEACPDVARGETVTLLARTPTVVIEARVIALEDGNRGDRIRVRHGENGETLRVRVGAAKNVELEGS